MTTVAPKLSDKAIAESKHKYKHPVTGQLLRSVTSIVHRYNDGDLLGAGAGAAVKLVKEGIDYRKEWREKADLGTRVHANIGKWALGKTTEVLDTDAPRLDAFTAFCHAKRPEWIATEFPIASSLGFGGRGDLVGEIEGDSWLLDGKTGKIYLRELALQLAGYANAEGVIRYDVAGNATSLAPMPHIDRWGGLYLGEDGVATLVEVPAVMLGESRADAQKKAFAAFLHLLELSEWADTQPQKPKVPK
jgi:hypothetical protein